MQSGTLPGQTQTEITRQ